MELWKLGWQGNQRQTEDTNNSSRKEPATSNGTSYFHSPRSEILSTLSQTDSSRISRYSLYN